VGVGQADTGEVLLVTVLFVGDRVGVVALSPLLDSRLAVVRIYLILSCFCMLASLNGHMAVLA